MNLNALRKLWPSYGRSSAKFECPVCGFFGHFRGIETDLGVRKFARCPDCNSLERHRLQKLVFDMVLDQRDPTDVSFLHIAPEPCHRKMFSHIDKYVTADLSMKDVDYNFDLQTTTPFQDDAFDIVFASHVLEHVPDDRRAISEIRRITKPGGVAILPVPVVSESTIEYPEPNPSESGHVRAPGLDYFDRYRAIFSQVEVFSSAAFPESFQLYVYEDRSIYPTKESPLRTPMAGIRHEDFMPVCHA